MKEKISIEKLKEFAKGFCVDGEVKLNLTKEEDGYRFHFLEDDYLGDIVTINGEKRRYLFGNEYG